MECNLYIFIFDRSTVHLYNWRLPRPYSSRVLIELMLLVHVFTRVKFHHHLVKLLVLDPLLYNPQLITAHTQYTHLYCSFNLST